MKAIVTVGISASGKTTWAKENSKELGAMVLCRDDIRESFLIEEHGRHFKKCDLWRLWSWKREDEVTERYMELLEMTAHNSLNVICADTNLNPTYREKLIQKLNDLGYEVTLKEFPVALEEAWKRDERRESTVGRDVIYKQHQQWLTHSGRKRYTPDTRLRDAIIVDVDGTLAHMGQRTPYEWDKVGSDTVDMHVRDIVNMHFDVGVKVIILSGRDGVCREQTADWLGLNNIYYDLLIMREEGDQRKDSVVKEEIFWQHIANQHNVLFAIDDRPVVCRMWRELGLKVFQVGDPHREF